MRSHAAALQATRQTSVLVPQPHCGLCVFTEAQSLVMESCGCNLDIEFTGICSNCFYFRDKEPETDFKSDDFKSSKSPPHQHLIQSTDNKCLLLDDQLQFIASNITQSMEIGCRFFLQMYNDSTLGVTQGRAVILYSNKENKKMVVCCNERNEVYPLAMELPSIIPGSQNKAVFFLKKQSASNMYTFESSLHLGRFLGFQPDEKNPCLKKLVLCPKGPDEVDDRTDIILN